MRYILITFYLFLPLSIVYGYQPLLGTNGIPFFSTGGGMRELLNALFAISVGVAAVLAVIMLAIGGFRYMASESVFNVSDAKRQISNAIIGLLIVLLSVAILTTINPEIVQFPAWIM